jgi:hypothetical protein
LTLLLERKLLNKAALEGSYSDWIPEFCWLALIWDSLPLEEWIKRVMTRLLRGGPFEAKEKAVGLKAEFETKRDSETAMCEL